MSAETINNYSNEPSESDEATNDLDFEVNAQDPVRMYLNSIGKIAILTAAEEQELSKDIEAGLYAQQKLIENDTSVSDEDHDDLEEIIRIGHESHDRIINANLRLVVSMAKKYQHSGVPLLDLVQEGNIALMHAVKKFDYKRGYRLSTTATLWIKKALITATYQQGHRISMTVKEGEKLNLIHKTWAKLADDLERDPTYEEVASETGIQPATIQELLLASRTPFSFDQPIGDDGSELRFGDVLSDINAVYPEAQYDDTPSKKSDKSALIDSLLEGLSERHQIIIRGLYGLNEDGVIKTHNEIGRELGLKPVSVIRSHDIIMNRLGLLATAESVND